MTGSSRKFPKAIPIADSSEADFAIFDNGSERPARDADHRIVLDNFMHFGLPGVALLAGSVALWLAWLGKEALR